MEKRKQDILKAVVHEFTTSAIPVGSQALASRYFVNISSATIRNELSELADLGYLLQPHTSSGRIPSDRGYRYFVDFLMEHEPVPAHVQAFIEGELRTAASDGQAIVERVATTIATVTQNASVVSAPHGRRALLKHINLLSLEPAEVLLIVLVEGNLLRQQVVHLDVPAPQSDLTRLANRISRELAQKDGDAVRLRLERLEAGLERQVLERVAEAISMLERGSETLVIHDGVRNLVRQPEFAEAARLQEVLEVLEETRHLADILHQLSVESDLQIVIGSENVTSQLRSCAVVLTTYGPSPQVRGVLGVVGPTRMNYGQMVGRLRAVADGASQRLAGLG